MEFAMLWTFVTECYQLLKCTYRDPCGSKVILKYLTLSPGFSTHVGDRQVHNSFEYDQFDFFCWIVWLVYLWTVTCDLPTPDRPKNLPNRFNLSKTICRLTTNRYAPPVDR